ncbi:MAG TPA: integrase, partial [Hyphomonas sp.]|nr:integrase [Hyphomonas sp.]
LEDFRMHDLRHSFASFGAANGLSLPIIGALLGHKNTSTTQRYAHLTGIAARQAANDVSDMVAAALGVSTG